MTPRQPRNEVIALLLTGKWVALSLLVVALSILFAAASSWQYTRAYHQVESLRVARSQPAPIGELVPAQGSVPSSSLGRIAVVEGSYVDDAWVQGRTSPDGQPGVWLLSAVDDGSGTLTAVLRGWLPSQQPPTTGSGGEVSVTGRVSSPENFYSGAAADGPDRLVAITDEQLREIWGPNVRSGYVVLAQQDPPPAAGGPVPVKPVFGTADSVGFPWQNAGYALQWLSFIGFVGFMYWRFFRDDLRALRAQPGGRAVEEASPADVP